MEYLKERYSNCFLIIQKAPPKVINVERLCKLTSTVILKIYAARRTRNETVIKTERTVETLRPPGMGEKE